MEIQVMPSESGLPANLSEIKAALEKQKLSPQVDQADWGTWINLKGYKSAISLDLERRMAERGVLEIDDQDPEEIQGLLFAAFHSLDWMGEDEDGPFQLG